jgi:hypothetical protein
MTFFISLIHTFTYQSFQYNHWTKAGYDEVGIPVIIMPEYGGRNTTIFAILLNVSTTCFGHC